MSPIPKSSKEIVKNCKSSLDELKAIDVCSFEVEEISSFTSFLKVASGTSGRHIQSIADKVIENLNDQYPGMKDRLVDGDRIKLEISVAIDGEISTLGMIDKVSEISEIHFLPAIAGG